MIVEPHAAIDATSVDEDGGTERAGFRGSAGQRVFEYLHLPASDPFGAVLICSPLHGEFARNYRREVLLARALARHGFAAMRFHYRFTGNSDGDGSDLTFDSMCEDALARVDALRREAPVGPLVVLGTRWGALIAASAAERHPDASVIFWEPLLEASRFFTDAFRSRLVRELRRGVEAPVPRHVLEQQLGAGEPVDVVAHRLEPALYRSSTGRSLEAQLGAAPRRVLVVQVGPTGVVRPELARLVDRWRREGLQIDAEGLRGDETWWLVEERYVDESARSLTGDLIEITAGWVVRLVDGGGR